MSKLAYSLIRLFSLFRLNTWTIFWRSDGTVLRRWSAVQCVRCARGHLASREVRVMPSTAPVIDIVSAMNHPGLFAPWFPGASWDHWRLCSSCVCAADDGDERGLPTVAERDPPTKQVRQLWCVVGRGGGKDSIASLIAAFAAALFEHRRQLRPGEMALVHALRASTSRRSCSITRFVFH